MDSDKKRDLHLNWAAWTSLNAGKVSFTRDWEESGQPRLWWGKDELQLKSLRRVKPEEFGLSGGYYGKGNQIYFVLPADLTEHLEGQNEFYVAGSFNGWEEAIGNKRWLMSPGKVRGRACHVLALPQADLEGQENATFKYVTGNGDWLEVPEDVQNTHVDGFGIKNYLFSPHRSGRHLFQFEMPLPLNQAEGRRLYFKHRKQVDSIRLSPGVFLKGLDVEAPLGALVEGGHTRFRLFAPRAASVNLFLFDKPEGPEGEAVSMEFTDDLVWEATVEGNRHGWFYHYTVAGQEAEEVGYFDPEFRILDPYARAVAGPEGPAIVVDDSRQEPFDDGFEPPCWHDLVVAEAHVRDLTVHAPVEMTEKERMGYTGLCKWIRTEGFYLRDLGVNAVELQPVHEFDTTDPEQYAWGYMPINYFAPASQYSMDPAGLSQIEEFREVVRSFHKEGMAVILDVVYNHVGEPNYLQYLDREYYFLLTKDGHYENHSGCGNTLDADTPMVRRLIRDSLVHWMEVYGVDGFRFDLGELLGKDTLAWLEGELKAVNPKVILIAEPWSFRGHIAGELRETGFASWNDGYRDYIRDYLTHHADAGNLRYFMLGSNPDWSRFPAQTVNYLASHDDRCWIDKVTENGQHDGHRPTANDRRRTHLAAAILMMSVGIPMVASGFDMMKSKGGMNNTYLRGDLNAIPYMRATEYAGTADYIRRWIAFRRSTLGRYLRLDGFPGDDYFTTSENGELFAVMVNARFKAGPERLLFVVNPSFSEGNLTFMDEDLTAFSQLADTERWGSPVLRRPLFSLGGDSVTVPPLACGLFMEHS